MIRFQGVCRSFGDVVALDRLSWQAEPGRVTVVLGPNGAGKTTASEIAAGLQRAHSGVVEVLGRDPWRADADHRARAGVMLQEGGLPQAVRPLTLLHHLSRLYAAPADVAELADRLGLGKFAGTTVRRLSGGQRQRVALAAALVGRPEVLLLDEPSAGLDPHVRREVWQLVREQAGRGTTVALTTHSFEEAERLADHVVVMSHGCAVASGTVAEVAAGRRLEDAYFALVDGSAA